ALLPVLQSPSLPGLATCLVEPVLRWKTHCPSSVRSLSPPCRCCTRRAQSLPRLTCLRPCLLLFEVAFGLWRLGLSVGGVLLLLGSSQASAQIPRGREAVHDIERIS